MGDDRRLAYALPGGEDAATSAGYDLCEVAAVHGTDRQAAHAVVGGACCSNNRLGREDLVVYGVDLGDEIAAHDSVARREAAEKLAVERIPAYVLNARRTAGRIADREQVEPAPDRL